MEEGPGPPEPKRRFLRELPVLVLLALAIALILKSFVVQAFFIPSASMEPTLLPGDRVIVNKLATRFGDVRPGDIVVFGDPTPPGGEGGNPIGGFFRWLTEGLGLARPPDEDFIKRVIALPGDTWEIRGGELLVNGVELPEPYLHPTADDRRFGPDTVPPGTLFVLGDNRTASEDSRFPSLGYVPRDDVVGKALLIVWPPSRAGWL